MGLQFDSVRSGVTGYYISNVASLESLHPVLVYSRMRINTFTFAKLTVMIITSCTNIHFDISSRYLISQNKLVGYLSQKFVFGVINCGSAWKY